MAEYAGPTARRCIACTPPPGRQCATCGERKASDAFAPRARRCQECRAHPPQPPPRACRRCGAEHPVADYRRGGTLGPCCAGTPPPSATRPRACLRCHEVKANHDFPWGDKSPNRNPSKTPRMGRYRRRSGVCQECWDREAAERAEAARVVAERQRAYRWLEDGVFVRRCRACDEVKVEAEGYYTNGARRKDGTPRYQGKCKACLMAHKREQLREQMKDPHLAAKIIEGRRERRQRWRKNNPEKYHAAQRRHRERVMADPERRARHLENRRIAGRLRREQEGHALAVSPTRTTAPAGPERGRRWLPLAPLLDLVQGRLRQALVTDAGLVVSAQKGMPTRRLVCEDLGISARTLSRWESEGGKVEHDTADRVLTRAGLLWHDVWFCDEHPHHHEGCEACAGAEAAEDAWEGAGCLVAA